MNTTQKLTLTFYPYTQQTKRGNHPLYCKITIDGARAQISTPYRIDPEKWDKNEMKLVGASTEAMVVNGHIDQMRSELNKHFLKAIALDEIITAKQLKAKYLGTDVVIPKKKTLSDIFDYHIIKLEEKVNANLINPKTLGRYVATKKKVLDFMKYCYAIKEIPLDEVKRSFITEFEHYLITRDGLQPNTAHKNLINLKKVMKVAVELEWIPSSPFTSFQCTYKNPERVFLTMEELDLMKAKNFSIERLNEVRDIFLFQCYTGFAYSDIEGFDRNAVSIGIDGEYWITTNRKKTGNRESVPLLPIALEILNKYQFHAECMQRNKLLPVNTNQRYNGYLKELADVCGIRKKITTHVARHTFATTITLSNGVPIETVSKMLGHTKLSTTQIYAKVLDTKVSQDMQVLKNKLFRTENPEEKKFTS